jgi:hypothetical protein
VKKSVRGPLLACWAAGGKEEEGGGLAGRGPNGKRNLGWVGLAVGFRGLGSLLFLLLIYFYNKQTKFEFKYKFEFKPHSNK